MKKLKMENSMRQQKKNFRKRNFEEAEEEATDNVSDDEEERRLALEEVKFLPKQRERRSGIPEITSALQSGPGGGGGGGAAAGLAKVSEKNEGDGEKDELVLQDTFAQETAVMVEDPNMLKYIEQQLAKKKGKNIDVTNQVENYLKHAEDELYKIPEHLKIQVEEY